ncbi:MAG: RNase adapter RapZ [Actinobacteria bacterium]|nr:RNase adapter RapZ [Actinomycetota bacterium]
MMKITKEEKRSLADIELTIITGLSGAGKSEALRYFEDAGYYCIDNLPAHLLIDLFDFFSLKDCKIKKIALAIDLRSGYFFDEIYTILERLKEKKIRFRILFLEASKNAITKRYSLTRRKHPLVDSGNLGDGIEKEIKRMQKLKDEADVIIDTTFLNTRELRTAITERMMTGDEKSRLLQVSVISFGYKYGMPENMDIVMDVRFLPNPYYDEELKELDGRNEKIIDFVMNREETKKFLRMFEKMLDFLIPNYIAEGKSYLCIGIGCTGGRHRSVVLSDKINEYIKLRGYSAKLHHEDINKK